MRTLKYAILGLINRYSMTGYDIAKEFNKDLVNFWNAKHSQIYPELKRLVEEELIQFNVEISGEVLEKKVYFITEKGKKEFAKWLNKNEAIEETAKDKFRLRMYFSENIDKENFKAMLESHKLQHQEKRDRLRKLISIYTSMPKFGTNEYGDYMVLDGAIMRENNYLEWIEKYIKGL